MRRVVETLAIGLLVLLSWMPVGMSRVAATRIAFCVSILSLLLVLAPLPVAHAAPVQWAGNGHYYDVVSVPGGITWEAARLDASTKTHLGLRGHLATITSQGEQDFIWASFGAAAADRWLGGFQPSGSPEPGGNWQWITGEPFIYSNWAGDEPSNDNDEDCLQTYHPVNGGRWNDIGCGSTLFGYIIEFEPGPPTPTPVILVHGWCGSPESFGRMAEFLSANLNVDVRAFNYAGESSPVTSFVRRDLKSLASRLAFFIQSQMDDLGVDKVDVVAHSMGGLLVRAWMAGLTDVEYTGEIRRLVLAGTPNFGGNWPEGVVGTIIGSPACAENIEVGRGQVEQMLFGSQFLKEVNENWELQVGNNVQPENILVVVGCGSSGGDCTGDGVVLTGSATLPRPLANDYIIRSVARDHCECHVPLLLNWKGITFVEAEEEEHYVLIETFLEGRAIPGLSVAPGLPLVALRLVEDTAGHEPFSESEVTGAGAGPYLLVSQKPSPDRSGWWTFTGVPLDCCNQFWVVGLSDPQVYPWFAIDVEVEAGRPTLLAPVTISPATNLADLAVTQVTHNTTTDIEAGQKLDIIYTVRNNGAVRSGRSFTRFYLSVDGDDGSADKLLITSDGSNSPAHSSVRPLKPGEQRTDKMRVMIPRSTVQGFYRVLACADDTNLVLEERWSNNCLAAAGAISVLASP